MKRRFFLSSEDWGEPWKPRECKYLATYQAKPTGQLLLYVSVSPPLPKDVADSVSDINRILLGIIDARMTLKDLDRFGFMVDIYIPESEPERTIVDVRDLVRLGVGTLHETRKDAESV
jgi:hypothetical protein